MKITDQSGENALSQTWQLNQVFRNGKREQATLDIAAEHRVTVIVNDAPVMSFTCTPADIIELALGRLHSEGYLDGISQVSSVDLCSLSEVVTIQLDKPIEARPLTVEDVPTCCTDTKNTATIGSRRPLNALPTSAFTEEELFACIDTARIDTPLHRSTYGVHSCSLFSRDGLLYRFEDIGRHNALDKAIGAALLERKDLNGLAAFTSGRVPVDMIAKTIRAGIPTLITKATPTCQSILLARRFGLTLIGKANAESFCVFSGSIAATPSARE